MPYELVLDNVPGGYAMSSARNGQELWVQVLGFLTSDEADEFVRAVEGFPSDLLARARVPVPPSMVDHLLAIIRPDRTVTLYVNEIGLMPRVRLKRSAECGQPIFLDDIADIDRLALPGIDVPPDAGVMFIFSAGWRKGYFFDLLPLFSNDAHPREYDLQEQLGHLYRQLLFQHVYKIGKKEWSVLLRCGWFPFVALATSTVKEMLAYVQSGWNLDDLVPKIAADVDRFLPTLKQRWSANPYFRQHEDILQRGLERYQTGDYVSAISVLTPRVEGILRTFCLGSGQGNLAPDALANSAVRRLHEHNPHSLLLPRWFRKYLNRIYRPFNPKSPTEMSRHTLAHGVAPNSTFNQKEALVLILTLDQLAFFLGATDPRASAPPNAAAS